MSAHSERGNNLPTPVRQPRSKMIFTFRRAFSNCRRSSSTPGRQLNFEACKIFLSRWSDPFEESYFGCGARGGVAPSPPARTTKKLVLPSRVHTHDACSRRSQPGKGRSEEHTSELQS